MNKNQTKLITLIDHDYKPQKGDYILSLIKAIFRNPEFRHNQLPGFAKWCGFLPGHGVDSDKDLKTRITFADKSNPLYLGSPFILPAGGNKFAENLPFYSNLGFGGVTVGTATSKPREGNPHRPRVAMIHDDRSINNSMGLNNPGVDYIASKVDKDLIRAHKSGLSIGISVAEDPDIIDEAEKLEDLLQCFRKAYNVADYTEINVSCPNTGNTRTDADTAFLEKLMGGVVSIRKSLGIRKAVYAKLSPDMGERQLASTLELISDLGINGLILFNTFPGDRARFLRMNTSLDGLTQVNSYGGTGGISGRVLYENTFRAVEYIKNKYPQFSIIASGGVDHGLKAWDLLRNGADAIQSYTVLAYRWRAIQAMKDELRQGLKTAGYKDLEEFFYQKKTETSARPVVN